MEPQKEVLADSDLLEATKIMTSDLFEKLKKLGIVTEKEDVKLFLDSGSYALNKVIGGAYNKGYPIPGIVEISGESSSGKTVFLAHAFRAAQQKGYYCKLEDAEQTWSHAFADNFGVDRTKLLVNSSIETLEDAFDSIEKTIKAIREEDKITPIVIGLDSLPVLPTKKEQEVEGYATSETLGMIRAKTVGSCLRKIHSLVSQNNVLLIIINQIRSKIAMFGSPDTRAAGGRSLEYYLSVGLKTSFSKSKGPLKDEFDRTIGIEGSIDNTKNKVAAPYMSCEFSLDYQKGLDRWVGLLPMLLADGLVKQGGAWYSFGEAKFQKKDFIDLVLTDSRFSEVKKLIES